MTSYPDEHVLEAVAFLKRNLSIVPQVGILTGSGLGGIVDEIEAPVHIRYADISHFPLSSVKGHEGEVVAGHISGRRLFVLSGRTHYYEGHSLETILFPIRAMASFGVKTLILTNAAGGINHTFLPGDIVAISGHMNLMRGISKGPSGWLPVIKEVYDPKLRKQAVGAADEVGVTLKTGVYAAVSGPCYETPAEVKALRIMGADMVGMSTAPEAAEANRLGLKVLGLSCITNPATGMNQNLLSHQEVIENSARILPTFKILLKRIIKKLQADDK
jgi:purine-nucleoside phosphorylase